MDEVDIVLVMRERGEGGDAACAAAAAEIVRLRRLCNDAASTDERREKARQSCRAISKASYTPRGLPAHERIKRRTVADEATGCWVWQGSCGVNGYGSLRTGDNGKPVLCHRIMYEHACGPIPKGMVVMHKCDNRRCCNPEHLQLGTQRENIRDMHRKGKCGRTVLNIDEVREIRRLHEAGSGVQKLASVFGVGSYTIQAIVSGRSWGWV